MFRHLVSAALSATLVFSLLVVLSACTPRTPDLAVADEADGLQLAPASQLLVIEDDGAADWSAPGPQPTL